VLTKFQNMIYWEQLILLIEDFFSESKHLSSYIPTQLCVIHPISSTQLLQSLLNLPLNNPIA
tara:strand:+ start:706 stop:891 length:186 start_codon:yes stop_codon:yes gene_type:complete